MSGLGIVTILVVAAIACVALGGVISIAGRLADAEHKINRILKEELDD